MKAGIVKLFLAVTILFTSCSKEYKPIDYGSDGCAHCKMTIMDARYGAEIITGKGKVFKFDDILCLKQYMEEKSMVDEELMIFVEKYNEAQNDVTDATQAVYLRHEFFASPMNGDYAAFAGMDDAQSLSDSLQADILEWRNLQ